MLCDQQLLFLKIEQSFHNANFIRLNLLDFTAISPNVKIMRKDISVRCAILITSMIISHH